ncbi:MAG: MFS transporter [Candidatus Hodarchaeales archaeon]
MTILSLDSLRTSWQAMNTNVKLIFAYSFFQSLGRGIWMGNVLSVWIYLIANESNELLGITSAITGFAMTITVLPAGYLSDKTQHRYMLRIAAIAGFVGLSFAIFATSLELMFLALLFWGLFQGLNRPSVESIFADSVESGTRSEVYAQVHLVRQLGMAIGPLVNVLLFLFFGDNWSLPVLKSVMTIGIFLSMLSLVFMILFDDRKSLGSESDRIEIIDENQVENMNTSNNHIDRRYIIISVLLLSNLLIGFGAGMTIKFFPIFFRNIYFLEPIGVQLIMGGTGILTGITSIYTQRLSLRRGRATMIFIVQGIATLCLFIIATYPPLLLLIPVFFTRGSLMNASQPLSRSILMDVVPKNHRGAINALQALAWGLFWNVSAAIGGFLIGSDDNFQLCFLITGIIYVIGTLPILVLIPLVSKEKNSR